MLTVDRSHVKTNIFLCQYTITARIRIDSEPNKPLVITVKLSKFCLKMASMQQRLKSVDQVSQMVVLGFIKSLQLIDLTIPDALINLVLLFYFDELPQLVQDCFSDDAATQFKSTQSIRKILSIVHAREVEMIIKAVIDSGIHQSLFIVSPFPKRHILKCSTNKTNKTTKKVLYHVWYSFYNLTICHHYNLKQHGH